MMRQPIVIAPSILSANLAALGQDAKAVIAAGADWLHFDVMDNHYVPNLTFGPQVCKSLRDFGITVPIDVHLMLNPVDNMIAPFAKAGASSISFHPDSTPNLLQTLGLIKQAGCQAGIAFNPEESLEVLATLRDKIDIVLLMSVRPGFAGQSFMPHVLGKARQARRILDEWDRPVRLQIDGGVKLDNATEIAQTGVDTFVAGFIFREEPAQYQKTISRLRANIEAT